MLFYLIQYLLKNWHRQRIINSLYKELFKIEVEQYFFKYKTSYYVSDVFKIQSEKILTSFNSYELECYYYIVRPKLLRKFFEKLIGEVPESLSKKYFYNESRNSWRCHDLDEIIRVYTEYNRNATTINKILRSM